MNKLTLLTLSLLFLVFSLFVAQSASARCGSYNAGALPNNAHYYCVGTQNPRFNYCGTRSGTLTGVKDHPLMCTSTWSNLNLTTVKVCAGEIVTQSATRGTTTRSRQVYSQNSGWEWTPSTGQVCSGVAYQQTSNCGAKRPATGTKTCCTPTAWTPDASQMCQGIPVTVTNGCSTQAVQGTKNCTTNGQPVGGGRVTDKHADTIWTTTVHGDEGYFQANGTSLNETILYNENRNTIIRRFQSAAGFPYRMWIDDDEPGGFGVALKDRAHFDNWLDYMEEIDPSTGNEYHPNKHWCELIESIWSPWVNDSVPPTTCGSHTYTRSRHCDTQQGAAKPCGSTCPNGLQTQNESESVTINNGSCTLPPTPVSCTDPWTPLANTQCQGVVFAQERCDGLVANGNRRGVVGTNPSACGSGSGTTLEWNNFATPQVSPLGVPFPLYSSIIDYNPNTNDCLGLFIRNAPPLNSDRKCSIEGEVMFCYTSMQNGVITSSPSNAIPYELVRTDYRCDPR